MVEILEFTDGFHFLNDMVKCMAKYMDLRLLYEKHSEDCLREKVSTPLSDDSREMRIITNDHITFIIHVYLPETKRRKEIKMENPKEPLLPPYPQHKLCEHFNKHYIFINKHMMSKHHLVISADSKDCKQLDPLNLSDCEAAARVINAYDGEGFIYYNCGVNSGCSQIHKHLQFLLLKDLNVLELMAKGNDLPFVYFKKNIDKYEPSIIYNAYKELFYGSLKEFFHQKAIDDICYNFICGCNTIVIIPRSSISYKNEVAVNSLGFVGHICVREEQIPLVIDDPMSVLISTGFPKSK